MTNDIHSSPETESTPVRALEHIAEVANYGAKKLDQIDVAFVTPGVAGALNTAKERFLLIARTAKLCNAQSTVLTHSAREYFDQIKAVCEDNAGPSCDKGMALDFVRQVATAALAPGNGAVEARPTDLNKVWQAAEACWASDAPREAVDLLYYEILRLIGHPVTGFNINDVSAPSPAALDPVTVEACAKRVEALKLKYLTGEIYNKTIDEVAQAIRALIGQPASKGEPVSSTERGSK